MLILDGQIQAIAMKSCGKPVQKKKHPPNQKVVFGCYKPSPKSGIHHWFHHIHVMSKFGCAFDDPDGDQTHQGRHKVLQPVVARPSTDAQLPKYLPMDLVLLGKSREKPWGFPVFHIKHGGFLQIFPTKKQSIR